MNHGDCSITDHGHVPELPEVEALARQLGGRLTGRTIEAVLVPSVAALKTVEPTVSQLVGGRIAKVKRRGKFVVISAERLYLVVHLARAGWIAWRPEIAARKLAQRGPLAARIRLDDGSGIDITEQGREHRLAIYVVSAVAEVPGIGRLGPDVLSEGFTPAVLSERLATARTNLKSALADQELMSGIGNAYSDEILHAARLSPFARSDRLDEETVGRLWTVIRQTLGEAIARAEATDLAAMRSEKKSNLRVHGRTGEPCPDCGDRIREVALSTRSFQYCPTCQTRGKVYADRRLSKLIR